MNDAFALAGRGLEHRGTEPRRVYFKLSEDTESLYFKFSEDTENSKTPWLCDSVFINFAEGGSPLNLAAVGTALGVSCAVA